MSSANNKRNKTLAEQTRKQKDALLEELVKCPIIQVACERTSIGRATYYSWRMDDQKFSEISDKALKEGRKFISDIAESQLIKKIKEGNMTSIIYWLKNNSKRYSEKFSDELDQAIPLLPPHQRAELLKALRLTGLDTLVKYHNEKTQKFIESREKTLDDNILSETEEKVIPKDPTKKAPGNESKKKGVKLNEFFKNHDVTDK